MVKKWKVRTPMCACSSLVGSPWRSLLSTLPQSGYGCAAASESHSVVLFHFLSDKKSFIAVGAVELCGNAKRCPSALWAVRSIVHQAVKSTALRTGILVAKSVKFF